MFGCPANVGGYKVMVFVYAWRVKDGNLLKEFLIGHCGVIDRLRCVMR